MMKVDKRCCTDDGGYILLYVMVVIVTMCIVAASICTSAVRNLNVQQHSVEHMKYVYEAEGVGERFLAELQYAVKENEVTIPADEDNATIRHEDAMIVLFNHAKGLAKEIALKEPDLKNDVISVEIADPGFIYYDDSKTGTCTITMEIISGDSSVDAEIDYVMAVTREEVKNGEEIEAYKYRIVHIASEYKKYIVGTVELPVEGGAE